MSVYKGINASKSELLSSIKPSILPFFLCTGYKYLIKSELLRRTLEAENELHQHYIRYRTLQRERHSINQISQKKKKTKKTLIFETKLSYIFEHPAYPYTSK